jgi:signal transduction histidine kinase
VLVEVLTAVLAAGVAGGYFTIAALIVPKIQLVDATPRFIGAFRVGGIAFFVGCGLTHTHIAYHALADDRRADLHEVVFHLMQVFGVWVFVYAALRFLDVRVVRRKTPAEQEAEVLHSRVNELSRSNEDLERFAHVVAHDLQQPLRTVSGFAELLEHRLDGRLDDGGEESLHHIRAASVRMSEMLDGVLEYSRLAGAELRREDVDLGALTRQVVSDLGHAIEASGAQVTIRDLPVVQGDPVQLSQLLQNLLANAVRFGRHVWVEARDDGNFCRVSISDDGPGVDARDRERIFELFQRSALSAREDAGTGLGLALAKKVVERHGGEIRVDERPGGGSTFSFTLPKRDVIAGDGLAASGERTALV